MIRILYIARHPHQHGPEVAGESLVRHLQQAHQVRVAALVVAEDSPLLEGAYAAHVCRESELAEYDAMVIEGGWSWSPDPEQARVPPDLARSFVAMGGQLVVCDVDRNSNHEKLEALLSVSDLLGMIPKNDGRGFVSYLRDDLGSDPDTGGVWFYPGEMAVEAWVEPSFEGVERLLVVHPIELIPKDAVAATGSSSTEVLNSDQFTARNVKAPWATIARVGLGHSVVIGAMLAHSSLIDRAPGNALWISNLLSLLTTRTDERRGWTIPMESRMRADLSALLNIEESPRLERKSSFLIPSDPLRPRTEAEMQHDVGKSISALANASGGHVLIGQDDERRVLGLRPDFDAVSGPQSDRDRFELKLGDYLEKYLKPGGSALGLNSDWLEVDGKDVLVIEVPKSAGVVHVRDPKNKNNWIVYVRAMTSTRALTGTDLTDWMTQRLSK